MDFEPSDVIKLSTAISKIDVNENDKILTLNNNSKISLPNIDFTAVNATWNADDTSVTYTPQKKKELVLSKDGQSITVSENLTSKPFTINGVSKGLKVTDDKIGGISLNGTTVTLFESVLNKGDVTISEGYTLAIADSVPKPEKSVSSWSIDKGTASYKDGDISEGHTVETSKIIYTPASAGKTLITIEGLSESTPTDGISLNGTTVTLSTSVLDEKEVTISKGYELALANDVIKSKKSGASWTVANGTATYKDGDTTAGYSVVDNKIIYTPAAEGSILTTVTGLKSDATVDGISLKGKVVTLSSSVLDKKEVKSTNGYSLALADDVPKPITDNITCNVTKGTVIYKSDKTEGYVSSGDKVVYNEKISYETLTTINGLKNDATETAVSLQDDTLNISKTVIGTEPVTVNATDDVAKVVVEGAGSFILGEQNFKVETPADFNLNTNGEVTSYQIGSAGRLTNEVSKVSVMSSSVNDTITNTGDNVHVSESAGSNNLINSGSKVTLTDSKGNDTVNNSGEGSFLNTGDCSDNITNSGANVTISGGAGNDKISVTDKASNVTINLSEGKNTVENHGSSIFINAGKDTDKYHKQWQ